MTQVADKVDRTIEALSLAVQNVGVIGEFSNIHLDEVRIAAIYLSAAVMDCLTALIEWVNASGTAHPLFPAHVSFCKGLDDTRF